MPRGKKHKINFQPMEVEYVSHMGSDLLVVNAARVSFKKKKETLDDKDVRLLKYLSKHKHWTPFAHPQLCLHIKAPMFVRAQCFKHKVGFVENEVSRRYVDDVPSMFDMGIWREKSEDKKQGSGTDLPDHKQVTGNWAYRTSLSVAMSMYAKMLEAGVAPEQARAVLPAATMTEWYWTGSLASWARFYNQRSKPDAQYEIQKVAQGVDEIIWELFPYSWEVLKDGV